MVHVALLELLDDFGLLDLLGLLHGHGVVEVRVEGPVLELDRPDAVLGQQALEHPEDELDALPEGPPLGVRGGALKGPLEVVVDVQKLEQ